ncbi:uncharacterized protein LOC114062976 [Empidonax traillii]|uniref:uncharacterized protein LOC114062976 n=1 Tax=Empidonax traillii TaxID=164674 RepID=UPI000FFD0271|nr:uncharacterized protein LOC114062976 [Empidonax traillii]
MGSAQTLGRKRRSGTGNGGERVVNALVPARVGRVAAEPRITRAGHQTCRVSPLTGITPDGHHPRAARPRGAALGSGWGAALRPPGFNVGLEHRGPLAQLCTTDPRETPARCLILLAKDRTPYGSRARDVRQQALPLFPVSPSVDVSANQTSPVEVNKTMKFTCHVKRFYPATVAVSWLENGVKIKEEKDSQPPVFQQGLLELRSQLEVQATEEKNGSMFTCLVVHDAQAPVNQSAILWIASPDQQGLSKGSQIYSGASELLGGVPARVAVWCNPLRKLKVPEKSPCGGMECLSLSSGCSHPFSPLQV